MRTRHIAKGEVVYDACHELVGKAMEAVDSRRPTQAIRISHLGKEWEQQLQYVYQYAEGRYFRGGKVCFEHNHTDGTQYPYYSPSEHENLFEFELD